MYYQRNIKLWTTLRLITGIILAVLSFFVIFQSCAAGLSNMLSDNNESSGTFGLFTAILMLLSGLIGIITKSSCSLTPPIICTFFLWGGFFFSRIGAGSYSDLKIWGFLCFFFGALYLASSAKNLKGLIVTSGISLLIFVLGII